MSIVHLAAFSGNAFGARAACRQAGFFKRPHQIVGWGGSPAHLVSGWPPDVTCSVCKRAWKFLAAQQAQARWEKHLHGGRHD